MRNVPINPDRCMELKSLSDGENLLSEMFLQVFIFGLMAVMIRKLYVPTAV